jgi:hypothetical protein
MHTPLGASYTLHTEPPSILMIAAVMKRGLRREKHDGVGHIHGLAGGAEHLHHLVVGFIEVLSGGRRELRREDLARAHAVDPNIVGGTKASNVAGEGFNARFGDKVRGRGQHCDALSQGSRHPHAGRLRGHIDNGATPCGHEMGPDRAAHDAHSAPLWNPLILF